MRLVQIPVSGLAGWLGDRWGHRPVLVGGVFVTGSSLACWMLATRQEWWWIWLAYGLFGGWAAINVAGPNLLLEVAPRETNAAAVAMFQNVAGLLAGLAGLAGGHWLAQLLERAPPGQSPGCYRTLFAVSLAGRLSAAIFLLRRPK
jgi:MFS family permease